MNRLQRRGYGFLIAIMMVGGLALPGLAAASTTSADKANSLMPNGCSSAADCSNKVHNGDATVRGVYQAYHITAISINQAVPGTVTKSGLVIVGGKTVATQAISFGRTDLPGSTPVPGVHAFKRPTSVSFNSSQLPAFVHMTNGRFDFAVIESCGNLVIATPVATPAPVKAKAVPAPAATPAPVVNVVQIQAQTQTQSQTQTAAPAPAQVQSTPAPTPAPQPVAAATPLPQTGASTLGVGGLSVLTVFAVYYWRSRRGLRLALRRS